jgi:hypothetical protein
MESMLPEVTAKKKPRHTQFFKIPQIVPPVGLWNYCHPVSAGLKHPANDRGPKRRVVHVCVSGKKDDIDIPVAKTVQFLARSRQHKAKVHDFLLPLIKINHYVF